jgi:hypothetical protein
MEGPVAKRDRPAWMPAEGVITLDELCVAFGLSDSTIIGLGIPHIKEGIA